MLQSNFKRTPSALFARPGGIQPEHSVVIFYANATSIVSNPLITPACCFRSNSAHDLGETVDPELLPDLETLQESFEIPDQLRLDVSHAGIPPDNEHRSQATYSHQDHGQEQHRQQQHHLSTVDHFNRSQGGASTDQQTAVAQPGSGAATPSGPCSTASDDSLQPGPQYLHSSMHQQPHGASTHTGGESSPAGPVRLAHSKSLPLLEDIDGLTELQQQAADMLADVSSACCEIKCNLPREL